MKLVYLASPYSKYPYGRDAAYLEACKCAAFLMEHEFAVFCPIAHSHSIELNGMPNIQDGDWWLQQDFAILKHCDTLFVYKMPGWDTSYGVGKEIEFAKENGIDIHYIENGVNGVIEL